MEDELYNFTASLVEDSQLLMDEYQTPVMAFTAAVLDKMESLFNCEEIIKEHCILRKSNGDIRGEIHAYAKSTNGEQLYLFYTDYNPSQEIKSKSNTDSQVSLRRLQGFYEAAIRCAFDSLDVESSEYYATKFIYDNVQTFQSVNLVVLSNYIINKLELKKISIATKPVYTFVWDLLRLYKAMSQQMVDF